MRHTSDGFRRHKGTRKRHYFRLRMSEVHLTDLSNALILHAFHGLFTLGECVLKLEVNWSALRTTLPVPACPQSVLLTFSPYFAP